MDITNLQDHLNKLAQAGVKLVIIDTPPAVTDTIRTVLAIANLVLIPTRPSPHNLRAVGSTVKLVEQAGKRLVFMINGAAPRARITGEAGIALSQPGSLGGNFRSLAAEPGRRCMKGEPECGRKAR